MPDPDELTTHKDEGYRALGRYIAEFSRMIHVMRDVMVLRLSKPGDPPYLVELVFGGITAEPITNAFFGMCRMLMDHDEDEKQTAIKLRTAVLAHIKRRNMVAHGDWYIGYWSTTGAAEPGQERVEATPPWVEQIRPDRKDGPGSVANENLGEHSEELVRLRTILRQYGVVCMGLGLHHPEARRVRDVVVIDDTKLEFGPLASRNPWMV